MAGIIEKKLLQKINDHIDDNICNKIINQYLYPPKSYLNELKTVSHYFKIIFIIESGSYYNRNKNWLKSLFDEKYDIKLDLKTFKNYYFNYKDVTINVLKTIKINDMNETNTKENTNLLLNSFTETNKRINNEITESYDNYYDNLENNLVLNNSFIIDGGIISNSTRSIFTNLHYYSDIIKKIYSSQRVYMSVLESLELSLDLELNDNNIYDLDDKSYKEKYELYKKL